MQITDQLMVVVPLYALIAGTLLELVLARVHSARLKGVLAAVTCVSALVAVCGLIPAVQSGRAVDLIAGRWDGPLTLAVHVDGLSVLFALMGTGLGAMVLLYSIGYMEHDRAATRFYVTMLLFIAGFVALVSSANLFFLYLCWEVIGLCSFSLVGFWYREREAVEGARKVLLMTHIAGYGLLAAILILYARSGTALWTSPALTRAFSGGIFLLVLLAVVAKSVQVPLHTWIPDAMAAPTPVSSLLHAACYVTAGVYLAARMHSFGAWPPLWGAALVWIGTVTMAVGVMYAMVQSDLKRMLAFSTVSQIGYMMMGLGIGTSLAICAGLLHCLNHGFFKGGLFLNAGAVQHAAGTRDMNQLGGLAQRMPRTTLAWLIGAANMAGVPLMSGFVSKWMLYTAALQSGWILPALIALVASLGTVFLCAKATSVVFLGPETERTSAAVEAPGTMQWGMGLMAGGSLVLGIAPQLAVNYILNPALAVLAPGSALQVTWFGLFSGAGSFSTTGGLTLALVSLLAGGGIYALAGTARPAMAGGPALGAGVFTGGELLPTQARLTARDFSEIFEHNWRGFFRGTDVDRIYLQLWHGLLAAARTLAAPFRRMEEHAGMSIAILLPAFLLGARWLMPTLPRSTGGTAGATALLLALACAAAAGGLLLIDFVYPDLRSLAPMLALSGFAAFAGLAWANGWVRFSLLEIAALITVVLVFQTATTRMPKRLYFAIVLVSAVCGGTGELLADRGYAEWAGAFLLTGGALKLAAIPFVFWLLRLADELPAVVLGQIIAVVDIAAFGGMWITAQARPALLAPGRAWVVLAALTSLLAAVLMLAQSDLKRLLVLSTVEDVGFLLLGLGSARSMGMPGALIAASTHALAKGLLFGTLMGPERDGALETGATGLAERYPWSAFGFLFGMLAMLGIPPTCGYLGRWRLYEAALEISPALLAAFLVASVLALTAYMRALTQTWFGPGRWPGSLTTDRATVQSSGKEPRMLQIVVVALILALLLPGLWPGVLPMLNGGRL